MRLPSLPTRTTGVALALAAGIVCAAPPAPEPAPPGLPPLGPDWQVPNPYRDRPEVQAAGAAAYERHCASCHGEAAQRPVAEGPDLRRLNGFCQRLADASLRSRCLKDVDAYFLESVLDGKLRAGVVHMPPWRGVLPQETVWAIRSFTESRPVPPPRRLPDLPPGGAVLRAAPGP